MIDKLLCFPCHLPMSQDALRGMLLWYYVAMRFGLR